MIEKSLIMIMAIYSLSFGILGMQYVIGDVFDISMTNYKGEEIKSSLLTAIDIEAINESQLNIVNANQTELVQTPSIGAAQIALEIFLLLTGTYVFNVLYLIGIPAIFLVGFVVLYGILLARTLIAYVRGI